MLWIVLALNLLVAGTKLAVGAMVGALSLFADGIHSLLDGVSNLVGLVGISLASAPADRDHPYGHRRFEALAALAIGLLVAAGAVEIVHQVADAFLEDRPPLQPTLLAAIIVGGTIV
ncbi:MAG: cation diffusion facilitator family transporter, partial [Myxococcales bacterium]|nr:cation diffusion facilitator family transporter [Myxococcales bacterium]